MTFINTIWIHAKLMGENLIESLRANKWSTWLTSRGVGVIVARGNAREGVPLRPNVQANRRAAPMRAK